jgi:hypothetical protein
MDLIEGIKTGIYTATGIWDGKTIVMRNGPDRRD